MPQNKTYNVIEEFNDFTYEEKIFFLEKLITDNEHSPREENKELYLLEVLKKMITNSEKEKMYNYISSHFNELKEDKKEAIFRRVYVSVRDGYDRQIHEENEKYCKENGHDFLDWEFIENEHSHHNIDFSTFNKDGINESVNYWIRVCKKCGYKEISYTNPNKKNHFKIFKK